MPKPNINRVIPALARKALELANGDRKAAYSRYMQLHYRQTGALAPGCDNKDLQAFYDAENHKAVYLRVNAERGCCAMQDAETVNLLPGFLKTVEKLGFQEKPELSTGVDEQVYVKGNWMLYVFPKLGIRLLEGII